MNVNELLFAKLVANHDLSELLSSEDVGQELYKLASQLVTLGKRKICEHIEELYGPDGSKLANLVSR